MALAAVDVATAAWASQFFLARFWFIGIFVRSIADRLSSAAAAAFFICVDCTCIMCTHNERHRCGPMLNSFHWQNKYLFKRQNKCSEKWMLAVFFFVCVLLSRHVVVSVIFFSPILTEINIYFIGILKITNS